MSDITSIGSTVVGFLSVGAMGAIWWDIRAIKTKVVDKIEALEKSQNECKQNLPKDYAAKSSVIELYNRTNKHAEKLSYIEGLRNGGAKK